MAVVLLVNPKSGRGIGVKLADRIERRLNADGFSCKRFAAIHGIDADAGEHFDPTRFDAAEALVVIGGDGTLSRIADLAANTKTPVYHIPVGNENLFAREFGMTRSAGALSVALQRRDIADTDLAWAEFAARERFLIMASCGPDAGVVRRLADQRTKAIGHLAYTTPVIKELAAPSIPRLTIEVDGERIVDARKGWLVVANARPYGMHADFGRHASVFSGKLDAVFMPCITSAEASWWMVRARLAWHVRDRKLVYRSGRAITVTCENGRFVWQTDGEAIDVGESASVRLGIDPGVLPVLRP